MTMIKQKETMLKLFSELNSITTKTRKKIY